MKLNLTRITLLLPAIALMTGCQLLHRDDVVARVGHAELHASQLGGVATTLTGADSLRAIDNFIDDWVHRQVKLQEAERALESQRKSIEAMVDDYRTSLLSNRLNQSYLEGRMDTMVTDSMVERYFNDHRGDFVMDRTIVKGRIVRLSSKYRQSQKLFALMGSKSADKQKDFRDICAKNNFELHEFDNWVDFSEFLSFLPVRRDKNYDYLLAKREIQLMNDSECKYFIEISDVLKHGEQAPYERVADMVKRILFSRRRTEIIAAYEDSLYQTALLEGIITIKHLE